MEVIQQFAENETYLYALRQQYQNEVELSIPDIPKTELAPARVTESLEAVLREPLGVIFFNHYLRASNSMELILFLGEVMQFEELPKGNFRRRVGKKIVQKYLLPDSRMALSLHDATRKLAISRMIQGCEDDNVFTSAKNSVQRDITMNSFPGFLISPFYARLLAFRVKEMSLISRNDFEFIRVLGKGGFGKVYAARKLDTRQMYACKEMSKERVFERKRERLLQNERHFLTRISHPFIVGLHYAFQDAYNLYFVMDLVTGGELEFHLHNRGRFHANWVRFFAAGITLALEYLHKQQVVYRDLKLENVLLDADGFVMLADLGLCSVVPEGQQLYEHCGTRSFMAPEQCMAGYRFEVDWWALGVCTYKLLTNKNPFSKIWREQEKPKEGLVSSILTKSIRQLSNLKSSISRRDAKNSVRSPDAGGANPADIGLAGLGGTGTPIIDAPNSPGKSPAAFVDEKKKQAETARRRKTTLLRSMFETTIRDLAWPDNVDQNARNFVLALLQMDPNIRLGHNGAAEVKGHEFFKQVDWNRLQRKHMVPPFVPSTGTVNAEYVESADNVSSKKRYPNFPEFDYVARQSFQREILSTMYNFDDLRLYRKHPPPKKLV